MKMLVNSIVTLAIFYLAFVLLIFVGQSRLIYFPQTEQKYAVTPDQMGLNYEALEIITTDNQTLHGWFVPAVDAKGTILFFHGNGGNISHRLGYLSMFNQLGYNTLIFDYRGYGRSSGSPSESGTYLDAMAAWNYLIETKKLAPTSIGLFGESLGGAIATWLAVREKPGILVLASTFTSIPDLAGEIYPFLPIRLIARFNYNTMEGIQSVTCPVLVAHSPQDEIVPFEHGQNLFQALPTKKQFMTLQGGHNQGLIFSQPAWVNTLEQFLEENLGSI